MPEPDGSPQRVRTRGPARPRNLAAGCLTLLAVAAALVLLAWLLRAGGPTPAEPAPVERGTAGV